MPIWLSDRYTASSVSYTDTYNDNTLSDYTLSTDTATYNRTYRTDHRTDHLINNGRTDNPTFSRTDYSSRVTSDQYFKRADTLSPRSLENEYFEAPTLNAGQTRFSPSPRASPSLNRASPSPTGGYINLSPTGQISTVEMHTLSPLSFTGRRRNWRYKSAPQAL